MSAETFTDWLRARDDEELRALFVARPELVTPVPAGIDALCSRATAPAAVSRALDRLDRPTLAVLEVLLVIPAPASTAELTTAVAGPHGVSDAAVATALDHVRAVALVWGEDRELRVAPGVREAFPHPAGLGPPAAEALARYPAERLAALAADLDARFGSARHDGDGSDASTPARVVAARLADPDELVALLDDAGSDARSAVDRLTWGPPVGRVDAARRPITLTDARSPIEHLLARGLLVATDDTTVVLPREVGLHLRGDLLFRDLADTPPALDGPARGTEQAERTAGGQALTVVHSVEGLLEHWGVNPPGVLRAGGLGVRDLRAAAGVLDVPEPTAALLVEVAHAAGLLARGGDADELWLPTDAYDMWRSHDVERRWATLATAWLETDRVPGLAGGKDARDRLINVLGDGMTHAGAPQIRRAVLAAVAAAPSGVGPRPDAVRAYLAWRRPRRAGGIRDRMIDWTLREAEALGLTGLGAATAHARALADDDHDDPAGEATAALAAVLPEPVDHVLIQADLTAVAPGPLVGDLARELSLMADIESTGGATVYRFTPASVRRALDAGRGVGDLVDLLKRHSATEVPQPLVYLVEDMARKHGHLRVGTASAYVRCDDPALLDEILADRRAAPLRLHRLAPTVVAGPTPRTELVDALRSLGYTPVAESTEGTMVITRPDARRAGASSRPRAAVVGPPAPDAATVAAAVRALRASEQAAHVATPNGTPPRSPSMATVERLRNAVDQGVRVWIGYLGQDGQAGSRIVEPARVEGGFVTAYDATRASVQRFALHRITGVTELTDPEGTP